MQYVLYIYWKRAKRKKHCNLRTGAPSKNGVTFYYKFANHQDLARLVRELELPDRHAEAPRRMVKLPYNSLPEQTQPKEASCSKI
jgi:hypothetical protein